MKLRSIFATCCIAAMATTATAQDLQFTEYLGKIPASPGVIPLAVGTDGELIYGTLRNVDTALSVIDNPASYINTEEVDFGTTIATFPHMINTRGLQSIDVAADGTIFVAGDNAGTAATSGLQSLYKFTKTGTGETATYTRDTTFETNVGTGRRSGVAVIDNTGAGVIATSGFATPSQIEFFNFAGQPIGTPNTDTLLYYRELVYNSADDILYPLRSGRSNNDMLRGYWENINTTAGTADFVNRAATDGALIDDGSYGGGSSPLVSQNGYYYEAQHQLITVDQTPTSGSTRLVRVWDIEENGTSVSLAYSIAHDFSDPEFTNYLVPFDAVVIDDKLYVSRGSSSGNGGTAIFVYGVPASSVRSWELY